MLSIAGNAGSRLILSTKDKRSPLIAVAVRNSSESSVAFSSAMKVVPNSDIRTGSLLPVNFKVRAGNLPGPTVAKYEIDFSADCWIVAGKMIGLLQLTEEKPQVDQRILLVPTRPGSLALPSALVTLPGGAQHLTKTEFISTPPIIEVKSELLNQATVVLL